MRPLGPSQAQVATILTPLLLTRLLVITAFSVTSSFGTHQLSRVEKRNHELGAQRNELAEMQELVKHQQAELAECRAALAQSQGDSQEAVCEDSPEISPEAADRFNREPSKVQIPTISIAGHDGHDLTSSVKNAEAADFANYFYSYAELDHQRQMLEDDRRMEAYRNAMLYNRQAFEGKTVLDVGSGSGVLAIFAAQAGAKKVYAVEYTDMAKHARELVDANGFGDVIEVIQGSAESIELPEKVDVIVSEFMGYFLLRESMLDSVIVARDRWLKDSGVMYPSHASMVWAAVDDMDEKLQKDNELKSAMSSWSVFREKARRKYGLDMAVLDNAYHDECVDYFVMNSVWRELAHHQVIAEPIIVKELDLHTCTLEDTSGLKETDFSFAIRHGSPPVTAFAGWFDVSFRGRDEIAPLSTVVELSTGPSAGYTHWGQQVFYLRDPIVVADNATVKGTVTMLRQVKNPRLYNVKVKHRLTLDGEPDTDSSTVSSVYKLS